MNAVRAAVVQDSPIVFKQEATIEKVHSRVIEAGRQGAQLVVMPMMGMGLFSGSMLAAGGSLMGHLVYGAVAGQVYGLPDEYPAAAHHAHA